VDIKKVTEDYERVKEKLLENNRAHRERLKKMALDILCDLPNGSDTAIYSLVIQDIVDLDIAYQKIKISLAP